VIIETGTVHDEKTLAHGHSHASPIRDEANQLIKHGIDRHHLRSPSSTSKVMQKACAARLELSTRARRSCCSYLRPVVFAPVGGGGLLSLNLPPPPSPTTDCEEEERCAAKAEHQRWPLFMGFSTPNHHYFTVFRRFFR